MTERALSFGAVAQRYHRFRPGYPAELADLVLGHAEGEVRRALEIGAGTGKATVLFAGRGVEVVAVEPDAGMRAVLLEETRGLPVQVLEGTFESVDLAALGPVDLVFAGASFHWTDPATRWTRTAAALRSGGVAGIFGSQRGLVDAELAARVQQIEDDVRGPDLRSRDHDAAYAELPDLPELTAVERVTIPRRTTCAREEYLSHLSTLSAYLVMTPEQRDPALARIRDVLPAEVEVTQDVTVRLARKV